MNCLAAHKWSSYNKDSINKSKVCGCFYCKETFAPSEVKIYTNDGHARCPKCTIDSVIGDASGYEINQAFLDEMRKFWFDEETAANATPTERYSTE